MRSKLSRCAAAVFLVVAINAGPGWSQKQKVAAAPEMPGKASASRIGPIYGPDSDKNAKEVTVNVVTDFIPPRDAPVVLDLDEIKNSASLACTDCESGKEVHPTEARRFSDRGDDPFGFSRLRYIREVAESKALNDLHVPYMVISASGMCEAGRILHHLKNGIGDPRNTILITGYQAENTLGRKLVEEWPEVPIFGEMMRRRAEVRKINELSGHADQSELLAWMKPMVGTLRRVFLVHGEPMQQKALAAAIRERYALEVVSPALGETHELE